MVDDMARMYEVVAMAEVLVSWRLWWSLTAHLLMKAEVFWFRIHVSFVALIALTALLIGSMKTPHRNNSVMSINLAT